MLHGYMLFAANTPIIGLDPHPAYAPDEAPEAFGASVWARLYHVGPNRAELEREAQEDMEDDEEAADEVFPVTVSDAGVLTVMDPDGRYVLRQYAPADVYGAFGMSCPTVLPDQRAEAWELIRDQLDGLAVLLRAAGIDRAETEYLQEDGIAGLQDVLLIGPDGDPVSPDLGEFPLPALVSSTEHGRVALVPVEGTGTLRDLADAVFESVSEFVLNDPQAVIDLIRIQLDADGPLSVETEGFVTKAWSPPGTGATRPDDEPAGP